MDRSCIIEAYMIRSRESGWSGIEIGPAAAADAAIRCEVLSDLDAVEALAPRWEALVERSRCNRAFSSPWWSLASCRASPGRLPYFVLAWRGGELAGVLPLAVVEATRTAEFAALLCDYNDLVAAAGDAEAPAALLAFASRAPHPFARLVLRHLRPDSHCLQAFSRLAPAAGRQLLDSRVCAYAPLPGSVGELLRGRGGKLRKGLRNGANRAARQGAAVRELKPEELPGEALPEALFRLHVERFGQKSCFHQAPAHRRLAAEALPRLFGAGRLKVFAVLRGAAVMGIDVCPLGPDSLCVWNGGFARGAAPWSAGKLLLAAEAACACRLGLAELDLLIGVEDYKLEWTTRLRGLIEVELAVRPALTPPPPPPPGR